jgi:acetolactate synthase-1/2/3 large subunit
MSVFVYERILQLLEAEGINTMFGIPDPGFVHIFTAAEKRGWRVVAPHHEEAGAFMAEGLFKMTGKPVVVVGNQGPGVANLLPAAINAEKENSPIIFIGGQRNHIADQRVRRGRIQYISQPQHFKASMKYVGVIEYPEQTDEIFHEAFRRALTGTPGPVFIEFPLKMVKSELDLPPVLPPEAYRLVHQGAGARDIDAAVELIREAQHPILLVGHGVFVSRAHEAVGALARAMECPVIQTSGGASFIEGLEDCTFPYGFSPAGVEATVLSDLVIAVGTEIGEPVHNGVNSHWANGNVDRKWIYIERDPTAFGVNRPIDVPLVGDLRDVVPQLVTALKDVPRQRSPQLDAWVKMHADHKAKSDANIPPPTVPVHPARLVYEATRVFPKDAIFVRDGGALTIFAWEYNQMKPRDLIWNQNFGHLGTGIPYAIGAALAAAKDQRVMLLSSDSAFLFHISELETAVRLNLPIVCVVGCDYAWGLEVRAYRTVLGEDSGETGAHWGKIRLDKIAEGFGAHGEYVERAEDIGPAVERALASGKTAVVQVPIDGRENAGQPPNYDEYRTWYTDFSY